MMILYLLLGCFVSLGNAAVQPLFELGAMTKTQTYSQKSDPFAYTVEEKVLHGGKQEGTLLLTVTTPLITVVISPSRGMNIVSAKAKSTKSGGADIALGWRTPMDEIINPVYINQFSRNGSGFLDGFSETVVRCGFEWIGHAGKDNGEMLTLHGMSAATPASSVSFEATKDAIVVVGVLKQKATKMVDFTVTSKLTIFATGTAGWSISDTLTNSMAYPHEFQALYHSNFGPPLLEEGSILSIAATKVEPFNKAAIPEAETWNLLKGPTIDYDETVYNIYPLGDNKNVGHALLHNSDSSLGLEVTWDMNTLPVFGLWKNTDDFSRGYVVGLEPGTAFSYNRKFNRELGLVKELDAKSSVTFQVTYKLYQSKSDVDKVAKGITDIQGGTSLVVSRTPSSDEKEDQPNGRHQVSSFVLSIIATALLIAF